MQKTIAALAALSVAAIAAPAQAQNAGNVLLDTFDGNALNPILIRMNAQWTEQVGDDGEKGLLVTFANGAKARLVPTACDDTTNHTSCRALSVRAPFAKTDRIAQQLLPEIVNRFNIARPAAKVTWYADGTSLVSAFIVGEGGIGSFNVQSQLNIFSQIVAVYSQELYGPPQQ